MMKDMKITCSTEGVGFTRGAEDSGDDVRVIECGKGGGKKTRQDRAGEPKNKEHRVFETYV